MKFDDLTGQRFERLSVLKRDGSQIYPSGQKQTLYLCRCDCGKEIKVTRRNLMSGNTKSCGCLRKELNTSHTMWGSKVYKCWDNMRSRCLNPNATGYENWGGRGIKIHEPWIHSFDAFYQYVSNLEHFGEPGYSLDRVDNDGNYEPGNLRWATRSQQAFNQRRHIKKETSPQ